METTKFAELFYSCIFDFLLYIKNPQNIKEIGEGIETVKKVRNRETTTPTSYMQRFSPTQMEEIYEHIFEEIVLLPLFSLVKDGVEINVDIIDEILMSRNDTYFELIQSNFFNLLHNKKKRKHNEIKINHNESKVNNVRQYYFIKVLKKIKNMLNYGYEYFSQKLLGLLELPFNNLNNDNDNDNDNLKLTHFDILKFLDDNENENIQIIRNGNILFTLRNQKRGRKVKVTRRKGGNKKKRRKRTRKLRINKRKHRKRKKHRRKS